MVVVGVCLLGSVGVFGSFAGVPNCGNNFSLGFVSSQSTTNSVVESVLVVVQKTWRDDAAQVFAGLA